MSTTTSKSSGRFRLRLAAAAGAAAASVVYVILLANVAPASGKTLGELDQAQEASSEESRGHELPMLHATIRAGGSYHIVYQLELANSSQVLTLEEWASFEDKAFRLDVIADKQRTSYLALGQTGELFRYRPFTCHLIANTSELEEYEVFKKLFLGYPIDPSRSTDDNGEPQPLVYGLGPMWLRARADGSVVKYERANLLSKLEADLYERYTVKLKERQQQQQDDDRDDDDDEDLELEFAFPAGSFRFVSSVDWIARTSTPTGGKRWQTQARLKVIQVDLARELSEQTFRLPPGYGCVRKDASKLAPQIDVGLVLLHQGAPNQAQFEVTLAQPLDGQLQAWTSRRLSLSMMRHSLPRPAELNAVESYYVSLVQALDARTGRLRRTKRVWWTPNSNELLGPAGEAPKTRSLVYEIDLNSARCRVDHRNPRDQLVVPLNDDQLGDLDDDRHGEDSGGAGGGDDGDGERRPPRSLVFSAEQLSFLFSDTTNFHLLHEESLVVGRHQQAPASNASTDSNNNNNNKFLRQAYLEKRLRHFELHQDGQLVWSGPVSIVKQLSGYSSRQKLIDERRLSKKLSLLDDYKNVITIFFFEGPHFDRLAYKLTIQLLANHPVDLEYVHKQLDVSDCFLGDEDRQRHQLVIKYPISDSKLVARLQDKRERLKVQMYLNLFDKTILTPLQASHFQLSFDYFQLQFSMQLLDLPLTHLFELAAGQALDATDCDPRQLLRMTASSGDRCAHHCEHYNCHRFSYDWAARQCLVELQATGGGGGGGDTPGQAAGLKVRPAPTSDLYSYVARAKKSLYWQATRPASQLTDERRPHLDARSIVALFREMLDEGQALEAPADDWTSADDDNSSEEDLRLAGLGPLDLTVELEEAPAPADDQQQQQQQGEEEDLAPPPPRPPSDRPQKQLVRTIVLRPASIESSLFEGDVMQEDDVVATSSAGIETEYVELIADRAYEPDASRRLTEANQLLDGVETYERCAQLCEDRDCKSFSYCQLEQQCLVTGYHDEKLVRAYSAPRQSRLGCSIYSLDYLSKFEPFGELELPSQPSSGQRLPAPIKGSYHAASERDCATICMDEQAFNCQGFYFCPLSGGANLVSAAANRLPPGKCNLISWHINSLTTSQTSQLLQLADQTRSGGSSGGGEADKQRARCLFYSRSYLAQFDKFHGKTIDLSSGASASGTNDNNNNNNKYDRLFANKLTIMTNFGAEYCAKRCVETKCAAFDVCPTSGRSSTGQRCQLAMNQIRASQLQVGPKCTTFVLSKRSQFNANHTELIRKLTA